MLAIFESSSAMRAESWALDCSTTTKRSFNAFVSSKAFLVFASTWPSCTRTGAISDWNSERICCTVSNWTARRSSFSTMDSLILSNLAIRSAFVGTFSVATGGASAPRTASAFSRAAAMSGERLANTVGPPAPA